MVDAVRWLWIFLGVVLAALQYRIWFGSGSLAEMNSLQREIKAQRALNDALTERNRQLEIEVRELQQGTQGFEEKAREEMGMIKRGETFFLFIPPEQE